MIIHEHGRWRRWLTTGPPAWVVPAAATRLDIWTFNQFCANYRQRTNAMVWTRYLGAISVLRGVHAGKYSPVGDGTGPEPAAVA